jgi:molybdopterin molybdotransferase
MVIERVSAARKLPPVEMIPLDLAYGRVLAAELFADRDYPPTARSVRDGFALQAADTPGTLFIIGEARAGEPFRGVLQSGEAVEIMTGGVLPDGADAVVMIEHVTVNGDTVVVANQVDMSNAVNEQGCESRQGDVVLRSGARLGYPEIAMLATVGVTEVPVYSKPSVSIVATGDEIVDLLHTPAPHQTRNSNAHSLAAQVRCAGGEAEILPVAHDTVESTMTLVERGLQTDLLLLSGGVSAGKYDVVERVLARFGAEFFFDRVLIQPGQPVVFGQAMGKFFFGLPGNPASAMVCFEVFARAALELLSGQIDPALPLLESTLATEFRHRAGLTRFLPARLSPDGSRVTPVSWSGSGDVAALARANAFLVADPNKPDYQAGDRIRVLLR